MNIIIGLVSGLVFFLCLVSTYLMGLKHGKLLEKKIVPTINPVTSLKEYVNKREADKKIDTALEGMNELMNYNPYDVKEGE
jgi:hypothetical protein